MLNIVASRCLALVLLLALSVGVAITPAESVSAANASCAMTSTGGRVTFGDERRPAHAGEVTVTLEPEDPTAGTRYETSTDSLGWWQASCVPIGYFRMLVHDTLDRYPDLDDRILLTSARSIYSNFGVSGSLAGTMRSSSGAPLAGQVILYFGYPEGRGNLIRQGIGDDGTWDFSGVPLSADQTWWLEFHPDDPRFASQTWESRSAYQAPTVLTVDDLLSGERFDVNLPEVASVTGHVTGVSPAALGAGRVDVELLVQDDASGTWARTGDIRPVAGDGEFEIARLPPGSYRLRARWSSGGDVARADSPVLVLDPAEQASVDIGLGAPSFGRDITSDGIPDLVARDSAGRLYRYSAKWSSASGGAQLVGRTLLGTGWSRMTALVHAGDFSGDGVSDIIARDSSGYLWLYAGTASGRLASRVKITSGWKHYTAVFAAGDMNSDGHPDLVARDSAGTLYLFPGTGAGHLMARTKIGTGWKDFTALLGAGDFNDDGLNDVLARDSGGAMWLYPGDGAGGLSSRVRIQIPSSFKTFSAIFSLGDLDGDHRPDLVVRDSSGGLRVVLNDGRGGLSPQPTFASGFKPYSIVR